MNRKAAKSIVFDLDSRQVLRMESEPPDGLSATAELRTSISANVIREMILVGDPNTGKLSDC